jgi:hypothetical protein
MARRTLVGMSSLTPNDWRSERILSHSEDESLWDREREEAGDAAGSEEERWGVSDELFSSLYVMSMVTVKVGEWKC